jgi:hypothetical protein
MRVKAAAAQHRELAVELWVAVHLRPSTVPPNNFHSPIIEKFGDVRPVSELDVNPEDVAPGLPDLFRAESQSCRGGFLLLGNEAKQNPEQRQQKAPRSITLPP